MQNVNFVNHIVEQYEKLLPFLPGTGNLKVRTLRHQVLNEAEKIGLPSLHQSTWKYALLQPLFETVLQGGPHPTEKRDYTELQPYLIDDPQALTLVFINGFYVPMLSRQRKKFPAATLTSFSHLAKSQPELLHDLIEHSSLSKHFFHLINCALVSDGALVIIPDDSQVNVPIYLYHILINDNSSLNMINTQTHLFIGQKANVSIVEKIISLTSKTSLLNTQTFVKCAPRANVSYYQYTDGTPSTYHFTHLNVHQDAASQLQFKLLSHGALYHRLETDLALLGSDAQADCRALILPNTQEHIDWTSHLSHQASHCHSEQMIKSVIGNKGHSTFLGNITVKKDAQQTVAHMHNHNLLLSSGKADTAPQLEIHADDVKCNHGATVGRLDMSALFYLQSRGIGELQAKKILIDAFVREIFNQIDINEIAQHFNQKINHRVESMIQGGER